MSLTKELLRVSAVKFIATLLPSKGKYRVIKFLYDYESKKSGLELIIPYLKKYNLRFLINTKEIIGWKILFFGEYEESTNNLLRKYIKPGDVVLEAGSNNGSETLLLSKLVGNGKVYGFEPIPHIFNRLRFNVEINELGKNIQLFQLALGEENKNVHFNIFPLNYSNQGMSSKYGDNPKTTKIEVKQVTLDSWAQENHLEKLNFLKMDIQGAELDLLKGGVATIQKFKPILFTEAASTWSDINTLYTFISELGYKIFHIENDEMKLLNTTKEIKPGNWLAFSN